MNFNSQIPSFIPHVNTYCAKVLPLVFDNSLSYYEFLCKMCHKVNECIDALNAQNLQIIEFTKMVTLELEKFEKYVDERISGFENEIKKDWEDYKTELNQAWEEYKTELNEQWAVEKEKNEQFRQALLTDFDTLKKAIEKQQSDFEIKIKEDFENYKQNVNAEIEQFETTTNTNFVHFKNTMQTQQNEFETHMVELFNNFKTTEKQARTDFESNFQQLFEQWKVDTLNAIETNLTQWESAMRAALFNYIDAQMSVYKESIEVRLVDSERKITQEKESREQADAILQRQINELTPEGAIKVDEPTEDGTSQLYKIDKETQERTDIFPKVKNVSPTPSSENGIEYLNRENGVSVNTGYFYIGESFNSFTIEGQDKTISAMETIQDFLLIEKSKINNLEQHATPMQAFLHLSININLICHLYDNDVLSLNIYNNPSTGIKFVNYNSTEYLSVPAIFKVPSSMTNVNLMNYTIVTTITQSPKRQ